MRNTRCRSALIGALMLSFLILNTQLLDAAAIQLRYGGKPGQAAVYKITMKGDTSVFAGQKQQRTSLDTEMFLTQRCLGVDREGIKMATRIESGSVTVNSRTAPFPLQQQDAITVMEPNGKVVQTLGYTPQHLDAKAMQLVFPEGPLKIGDTWTHTIQPSNHLPVPLIVQYRILKLETLKGFECVKIASTVRSGDKSAVKGLSVQVAADGLIYFAYKEGWRVKNEVTSRVRLILKRIVGNTPQSIITKMTSKMCMELQN